MKKSLLAATLASAMVIMPAQAYELDTEEKKLSYSLGLMLGEKLKQDIGELDVDAFRRAVDAVYKGEEPLLNEQQVGEVMTAFQMKKVKEQQEMMAKISADNLKRGQEYMAENAKKDGVTVTDSGLHYKELTAGEGNSPGAEDTVKVHYRGELTDGTVFDSSYARGEPVSFPLNGVIPGWTEGLQLMKKGGKAQLVIPAELAYGARGMGNAIGPNEALVFEVELLDINPDAEVAAEQKPAQ